MYSCVGTTVNPKEALTFWDVAVDFTEEEWTMLDMSQKKLHRDVMSETISHLLAVGADFCASDVIFQLEPGLLCTERREFFRVLRAVSDTESEPKKHEVPPAQAILRKEQPAFQPAPQNFNPGGEPFTCNDSMVDSAYKSTSKVFNEPKGKPYLCNHCGKGFRYYSSFTRHKQMHTGEKPYTCQQCGAAFRQSSNLRRHERSHTGEKPYKCGDCGKAFSRSTHLHSHQKSRADMPCQSSGGQTTSWRTSPGSKPATHPRNKPYVCRLCGQTFSQQSSVYRHGQVHTAGKSHVCQQCGKAFAQSYNLRQHERIHTGEKPYKCNVCGQAFRRSAHVIVHQRTHTGEKPYRCNQCGTAFSQNCHLLKHQRTHTHP